MSPLASSHSGDLDKAEMATVYQREEVIVDDDRTEVSPGIHSHTILAITAMAFIYIGQMVSLVGAGAVSLFPNRLNRSILLSQNSKVTPSPLTSTHQELLFGFQLLFRFSQWFSVRLSRRQLTTSEGSGC